MTREIFVFGDWQELRGPQLVGLLRSQTTSGKETFSFEYDPGWLQSGNAFLLDPELKLFSGPQYSSDKDRPNFGMFLDSSPDQMAGNFHRHTMLTQIEVELDRA